MDCPTHESNSRLTIGIFVQEGGSHFLVWPESIRAGLDGHDVREPLHGIAGWGAYLIHAFYTR